MDVLECIKNRRSVSVYKDTPVPDGVLGRSWMREDGRLRGLIVSLLSSLS